ARAGRPRGGAQGGGRRRRRLDPEALPRLRRAGVVHARQRRAENALAQDGARNGRCATLQHLRVLTAPPVTPIEPAMPTSLSPPETSATPDSIAKTAHEIAQRVLEGFDRH